MDNIVPADQELETTCKVSCKHRNYNCVRRTGAGILAFILSALMIFLTTSFLYVSEKCSTRSETTNKPSCKHRNYNCVRRTVVGTLAFILSGLMILLTALFVYAGKNFGSSLGYTTNNNLSLECSNYTYPTCRGELRLIRDLLGMEPSDDAALPVSTSNITLEQNEDTAILFEYGLDYVRGAQECKSSILSFMCLYLFPVCDENGTVHRPGAEDCHEIAVVCKDELEGVLNLRGIEGLLHLPDCLSLPNSSSVLSAGQISQRAALQKNDGYRFADHMNCSENFFFSNDSCLPRCDKWNTISESIASITNTIKIATSISIILLGIAILIISCFDFSRMYAFPSVLLLHFVIFIILYGLTTLTSLVVSKALTCSSVSLLEALEKPTVTCSIFGSLQIYLNTQLEFWWFAYIAVLFWHIQFPFQAKRCKQNGRSKYIYVGLILASFVVPVLPFMSIIIPGGYNTWVLSPEICTFKNFELAFYVVLIPINLSPIIGTPLMIVVITSLIKHRHSKHDSNNKSITADRKILFELCYYVFFFLASNVILIMEAIPNDQFATKAYKYFHCESKGWNLCDAPSKLIYPIMNAVYYILFMTLPLAILCTMAPVEKVTHVFKKAFQQRKVGMKIWSNMSIHHQHTTA